MSEALLIIEKVRYSASYLADLRQPSFVFNVRRSDVQASASTLDRFNEWHTSGFPTRLAATCLNEALRAEPVFSRVALLALDILSALKMPVMSGALGFETPDQSENHWTLTLPAISREHLAPVDAMNVAVRLLNRLSLNDLKPIASPNEALAELKAKHASSAPKGVNSIRFLEAAYEQRVPWRWVARNVYQFGWGKRSRLLDSSFTDQTSAIGAVLARDKVACAAALRAVGIPVPRHQVVQDERQAVDVANRLGYPVVVKPMDLDGGRGVRAGLRTAAAVGRAYAEAKKLSARVMVEQFIPGHDYRFQVFQGEVFWIVHRRPAKVIGDGRQTISELIAETNRSRDSSSKSWAAAQDDERGFYPINHDDEVEDWLEFQGMSLATIPAPGLSVRLRGAANVALGGTRQAVKGQVHPDNLALARKAVSVLRLDLAGVDILLPDISRSWRETGGGICEVNSQPQLAGHLPARLLGRLMVGQGRISTIILFGLPDDLRDAAATVATAQSRGLKLAWAREEGECRQALADPEVDALIWELNALPHWLAGSPFDSFDLFVMMETVGSARPPRKAGEFPDFPDRAAETWVLEQSDSGDHTSLQSALIERLVNFIVSKTNS